MFTTPDFEPLHEVQIDTCLGDYHTIKKFHENIERLRKAAEAIFPNSRSLTKKEQRLLKKIQEKIFES